MLNAKVQLDRRQYKRFRVQDGAFVILRPGHPGVGRLIDISMGGLRFEYMSWNAARIEAVKLDICLKDSAFGLYDIPCQSIWEETIYETPPASFYWKRCGVEFGELTQAQISQLESFIQNYTEGEVED
jgi:hypothetical protein